MIKYTKLINEETKEVSVLDYAREDFLKTNGYTLQEVEQGDKYPNNWYLKGFAPMKSDEEKAREEQERVAKLFLTSADVERGIFKAKGLDFDDVLEIVKEQQPTQYKAVKIELKANNFYRGNPYVDMVGAKLGITPEQMTEFFETNDWTTLSAFEAENNGN